MKDLIERVKFLEDEIYKLKGWKLRDNGRKKYTVQEFKLVFKPGDKVIGWATGKVVEITAIGNSRFLCLDHNGYERVCTIEAHEWELSDVNPPRTKEE